MSERAPAGAGVPASAGTSDAAPLPRAVRQGARVIVPALREARTIGDVVRQLVMAGHPVTVVDDGSDDDTAARAREAGADVVRHAANRGQGAALQTGFQRALELGARYVVTFDADGQHDVADIDALLRPLVLDRAEVALGSRFLGRTVGLPRTREALLRVAVVVTRLSSGLAVTDAHDGLRAFSAGAAARLHLRQDRMAHASEILDQVRRLRLRWVEVPVTIRYTTYSRSKGQRSTAAVRVFVDHVLGRILD